MKYIPVEWSPHLFTQPTKDDDDDGAVVVQVVSVESSSSSNSPIRCGDSSGSSSISSSNSHSSSSITCLDDTSISFQSLSLQQPSTKKMMGPNEKENRATKRRIVKAARTFDAILPRQQLRTSPPPPQDISPLSISSFFSSNERIQHVECKITLKAREQPFVSSIESGTTKSQIVSTDFVSSESSLETLFQPIDACISLTFGPQQAPSPLARSKRLRGGSDLFMAVADGSGMAAASDSTNPPFECRKRRRLYRNRAMIAQEFDVILSQINNTGSL
jgi:hypothetical protein